MKWQTKLPKADQYRCLVTVQPHGGKRFVTIGWVTTESMPPQAVAWMPMPEHIIANPDGWFSQYRGDDDPGESDWYLVCYERYNWLIGKKYYDTKKGRFLAEQPTLGEPIAWRPLPKPYARLN